MARVTTLKDRIKGIISKYKRINGHRFVYNNKSELTRTYSSIKVWFLIHDEERGYSVMPFTFKRSATFNVAEWTKLFQHTVGKYNSLFSVFTQAVLPAINNKGGNNWRFKALLAWTGATSFSEKQRSNKSRFAAADEIHEAKNPAARRAGNKATSKRHGKSRRGNRG